MGDASRPGRFAICKGCGNTIRRTNSTAPIRHYCGPECRPRCTIEGCEKPQHSKGWCHAHYQRWYSTGDPLTPRTRGNNEGTCSVEGCEQPMRKRGWCANHYTHWYIHGDVDAPWAYHHGEGGYAATHRVLTNVLGPAKRHACVDCGGPAHEWSYDGNDPNEQVDEEGRRFTRHARAYSPRCVRCHRVFDGNPIAVRN